MSGITKYAPINNNGGSNSMISDFKTTSQFFAIFTTKKTASFVYCFIFICSIFTIFLAFSTSTSNSSLSSSSSSIYSDEFYRSQFSSIYYYFFSNSTSSEVYKNGVLNPSIDNFTAPSKPSSDLSEGSSSVKKQSTVGVKNENFTAGGVGKVNEEKGVVKNATFGSEQSTIGLKNVNFTGGEIGKLNEEKGSNLSTIGVKSKNFTASEDQKVSQEEKGSNLDKIGIKSKNLTVGEDKKVIEEKGLGKNATFTQEHSTIGVKSKNLTVNEDKKVIEDKGLIKGLKNCDLFDGNWVKDESYPLYKPGSCSLIDEQFNCFLNGRPDNDYYKLKWKPKGCTLPRLNGSHMLELLRGKRLVFVGDSLNRNMWESLVCILRNSLKDPKKAYEESGRHNYRTEPSYSFVFEDYKTTVEFFVSPFLVQESEAADKNGTKKETLRLDIIESFADKYQKADVIVFNTGHWWTHEKTSKGKDYYQEGSHVYSELNVDEAFRKALTTWGIWVDKNVNPKKSLVFFRGYSASHFSGGQWNSGGQCDNETESIKNDAYLTPYPLKMTILEKILKGMKTNVGYLNVTRMTDYRKDGHPSIYRKLHLSAEEAKSPLRFQDCSHWCLPGVPDAWNEVLYAQLLVKLYKL